MIRNVTKKIGFAKALLIAISIALLAAITSCAGEDYTPVYFPPPESDVADGPSPGVASGARQCTVSFTSQLCVQIKGDNIEVGTENGEELCAEVDAFPIHISGATVTLKGSEFPDINVEGHGLPAPITINARGDGDGSSNVGQGTIDPSGNITIEGFSFFIVALGIVGEVPNLTLTTGATEELTHLPATSGSAPDASGAMTLVTATTLGHIIEAADEYLMGASLIASFRGQITPPLSQCGGDGDRNIEVKKVAISADGQQTESAIPEGSVMEISTGTFIAETSLDIGPRYETNAKFRVQNVGTKTQILAIPPRKGAFHLSSATTPLTGSLAPQQSFILDVAFRPTQADSTPGKVIEHISIGPDQFQLTALALSKSGKSTVSVVDENGTIVEPDVEEVEIGDAAVQANAERKFFLCEEITCNDIKSFTSCGACPDPTTMPCELLTVSTEGKPLVEVDENCNLVDPDAAPTYVIDLKGSADITLSAHKQVLAIRNMGVEDINITGVSLEEIEGSKSTGQFSLPEDAIFVADSIDKVAEEVAKALSGKDADGAKLPVTLPPYQPGYQETSAFIVITYTPDDLVGADGGQAGVGSKVTDKAVLTIKTDEGDMTTEVTGTTTISETPALELYFKTSTGTKHVPDGMSFPFHGITAETIDLAVPVFLRVADTASSTLRITSIAISGEDEESFRWLDTKDEIESVNPPAGKGLRCSIPIVDEETGDLIDESFDLNPISIGSGFDMAPGAYSISTMPLFGCADFHRAESADLTKRLFKANLEVEALELDAKGLPAQNPDGSPKKTLLTAQLLASIDPISGKFVFRVTQTMAVILNPQFPGLSAISSKKDLEHQLESGEAKITDLQLFTGALILDPFDEMTIKTADGLNTLTTPNDGITGVFRPVDTHPATTAYDEEGLFDYANLIHDATLGEGAVTGVYADYPNVPEGARANGWRIFTSSFSYPGPLAPPDKAPNNPSDCIVINPCDPEQQKLFTDAGVGSGKGACAFFYASGGRYDSPAFHTAEEMDGGEYSKLCSKVDVPQNLYDIDTGRYTVDGHMTFEEIGLRFFGPTYFHNPGGPLGPKPPMDAIFHLAFTTGTLKPQDKESDPNALPDTTIDLAAGEYKINLNDNSAATPPICENSTKNKIIDGKPYSAWRYLDGLLFKDPEGDIPAGCPEDDNEYTGGIAYLRGKPVDPATGIFTVVGGARFGSSDDLSFAFKDVMMFIAINGWLCDPEGSEENFEGSRCFDVLFNDRDALSQKSLTE